MIRTIVTLSLVAAWATSVNGQEPARRSTLTEKAVATARKRIRIEVAANRNWHPWEQSLIDATAAEKELKGKIPAEALSEIVARFQIGAEGAADVGQLWTVWAVFDHLIDAHDVAPKTAFALLDRAFRTIWRSGKFAHPGFKMSGHEPDKKYWSPQAHFTASLMMARVLARSGRRTDAEKAIRYGDAQLRVLSKERKLHPKQRKFTPEYHLGETAWLTASIALRRLAKVIAPTLKLKHAAPEGTAPEWGAMKRGLMLLGRSTSDQSQWSTLYYEHSIVKKLTDSTRGPAHYEWIPDAAQLRRLDFDDGQPFLMSNHAWVKLPNKPLSVDFLADDAGLVLLGGIPLACWWEPGTRFDLGLCSGFRPPGGFLPLDTYGFEVGRWNEPGRRFALRCNWLQPAGWMPSNRQVTRLASDAGIEFRRCTTLQRLR